MNEQISNQQAANELKAMQEHVEPYMSIVGLTAYNMAIKALEQTRWIPVSERLPEKNGNYLVTVEANDGTASIKYQMVDHYGPAWLHEEKHQKVIAWMPLPEPYQSND